MSSIIYKLEYSINTSASILYNRLTTPSGLSEWFADDVDIKNDIFTFYWENSTQEAVLLNSKKNQFIRFQWIEDKDTDIYFEFSIQMDDMTKDIALIITDFADNLEEKEEESLLWNAQVDNLKKAIGI